MKIKLLLSLLFINIASGCITTIPLETAKTTPNPSSVSSETDNYIPFSLSDLKGKLTFSSSYESENSTYRGIYIMNSNSSTPVRISETGIWEDNPVWSTDGKKIFFVSQRHKENGIYSMNTDGTDKIKIMDNPGCSGIISWTADRKKFVCSTNIYNNAGINIFDLETRKPVKITDKGNSDFAPDISHNGKKIVYTSATQKPLDPPDSDNLQAYYEIFVINSDGTEKKQLTFNKDNNWVYSDSNPTWSPDGRKIVFTSNRTGLSEIYVMNADGSNQTRLTNNQTESEKTNLPVSDFYPNWSYDGNKIIFTSNRSGNSEIYVMNADGSNQIKITDNPGIESYVDWFM